MCAPGVLGEVARTPLLSRPDVESNVAASSKPFSLKDAPSMVWLWIGFVVFVLVVLALDLGVLSRRQQTLTPARAMKHVAVFVAMGLAFNVAVYFIYKHDWLGIGTKFATVMMDASAPGSAMPSGESIGRTAAMQFLAGWLTEYSLSVDNLFVIALIFAFFRVPAKFQHRVLFWGILGALVARFVMIFAGTALVTRFEWLLYILGAFLVYTGIKMALANENDERDFDKMLVVRIARKLFPISKDFDGERFFTRLAPADGAARGALAATPLFLVLLIIETTDVIFAVDSIPAIIGITQDPFIIFTSNVFAILGLRSLFFALAALMDKFHFLKFALAAVLVFVGVKMLLEGVHHLNGLARMVADPLPGWAAWLPEKQVHVPIAVSLGFIVLSLTAGVVASLIWAKRHKEAHPE